MLARNAALLLGTTIGLMVSVGAVRADAEYDRCIGKGPDNITLGNCGSELVTRTEARLNEAWDRLMSKVSGQTKDALIIEQGAWLEFKERACNFYASGDWGREGTVFKRPQCKTTVILERLRFLEDVDGSVRR